MRGNRPLSKLTLTALIAALYTALCFTVPFLSFGPMQFRLSEALCVLPLFYPPAVGGLTLGCFVSNLVGFLTGLNPVGLVDSAVGTLATLLATLATWYIGRRLRGKWPRLLVGLVPPVVSNALIVGAELTVLFYGGAPGWFVPNLLWVALGEAVVCYGLGLPLGLVLSRGNTAQRLFEGK